MQPTISIYFRQRIRNQKKLLKNFIKEPTNYQSLWEFQNLKIKQLRQELALNPQLINIGRILQTEQIVQEIQNFGIRKTEQAQILNDPMEIKQQPPTSENPYRKILIPYRRIIYWYCNRSGRKVQTISNFNKNKRNHQKLMRKYFQDLLQSRRQNNRKKILQLNKKAPNIQKQQMNSIRKEWEYTFRKSQKKQIKNYESLRQTQSKQI